MTCDDASGFIGPYAEGDLPEEALLRMETHLLTCQRCAWEAETLRIARRRLQSERTEEVASDAFRARVLRRLRADNPHLTGNEESAFLPYQLPMPF